MVSERTIPRGAYKQILGLWVAAENSHPKRKCHRPTIDYCLSGANCSFQGGYVLHPFQKKNSCHAGIEQINCIIPWSFQDMMSSWWYRDYWTLFLVPISSQKRPLGKQVGRDRKNISQSNYLPRSPEKTKIAAEKRMVGHHVPFGARPMFREI